MTLNKLRSKGIILAYTDGSKWVRRLIEIGFVPGKQIEFVRIAFLGKTIEFKIDNMHISLRDTEASLVNIKED